MYTVDFWSFAKRPNSTKVPATAALESIDCEIVDQSGFIAPVIKLNTSYANPTAYNYAYIADFNKYYFVRSWSYDKGLWIAALAADLLGSYKAEIGELTLYVLRAASDMDGRIVDTMYPIKAGTYINTASNNSNPLAVEYNSGYFVVGVINNDAAAIGVVSYYVFTTSQFRTFCSFLMGNTSYLNSPPEISDALLKCLVNPTQYIVSCIWLPLTPPTGANVSSIPVGWWSVTASAARLSGYSRATATATISVPKHPNALARGYYLLQEPYSTYYLDFPPFGAFSLPANKLVDETLIDLHIYVDCITGQGRLEVIAGPTGARGCISVVYGQVGVPIALAQNAPNIAQVIQDATATDYVAGYSPVTDTQDRHSGLLSTLLSGTKAGEKLSNWKNSIYDNMDNFNSWAKESAAPVAANIANAAVASKLPLQVIGGNGGIMSGYYPIKLYANFATLADENNTEWGRPLCRSKKISSLAGFIKCASDDFELAVTDEERSAIANFLTSGFFYE